MGKPHAALMAVTFGLQFASQVPAMIGGVNAAGFGAGAFSWTFWRGESLLRNDCQMRAPPLRNTVWSPTNWLKSTIVMPAVPSVPHWELSLGLAQFTPMLQIEPRLRFFSAACRMARMK